MKVWKKNAVIAVILLFICVAVYLNWSSSSAGDGLEEVSGEGTGDVVGEAELVSEEDGAEAAVEGESSVDVSTVEEGASGDYFDTARLTREQARDSSLALLEEAAQTENTTQDARDQAIADIQALAAVTLTESQIENLITAKGFEDCIAFINDSSISVVVMSPDGGLTSSDVAKITDIVTSQSGLTTDQIKIIEVK